MLKLLNDYRWEQQLRLRFIEIVVQWEGQFATNHLMDTFNIGRQQASKDISAYNEHINPDALKYDASKKRHVPNTAFTPQITHGTVDEYLTLLSSNTTEHSLFAGLSIDGSQSEVVQLPIRSLSPSIIRPLLQACKERQRLDVDYVSIHRPSREGRVIVPHTLVNNGKRWHVRAWCEQNQDYRDFVLSRFRGSAELMGESQHGIEGDVKWNTLVPIIIKPDMRLSDEQQEVVELDYGMTKGELVIHTRGALVHYVLQGLQIDTQVMQIKPEAQQICVANLDKVSGYLFG